ncbi:MAG: hypothetical protein ACOC0O_02220 [Spirochaetota bacterium]
MIVGATVQSRLSGVVLSLRLPLFIVLLEDYPSQAKEVVPLDHHRQCEHDDREKHSDLDARIGRPFTIVGIEGAENSGSTIDAWVRSLLNSATVSWRSRTGAR